MFTYYSCNTNNDFLAGRTSWSATTTRRSSWSCRTASECLASRGWPCTTSPRRTPSETCTCPRTSRPPHHRHSPPSWPRPGLKCPAGLLSFWMPLLLCSYNLCYVRIFYSNRLQKWKSSIQLYMYFYLYLDGTIEAIWSSFCHHWLYHQVLIYHLLHFPLLLTNFRNGGSKLVFFFVLWWCHWCPTAGTTILPFCYKVVYFLVEICDFNRK